MMSGANIGNMLKTMLGSIHSDKSVKEIEALGVKMTQVGKDGTTTWRPVIDVLHDLAIATQGSKADLEDMEKAASGGKEFASYDVKTLYKKLCEPANAGCGTVVFC